MAILYATINTTNDKFYIGVHAGDDAAYLGSGSVLRAAVKKYGAGEFVRLTIDEFDTIEEALAAEADLVTAAFIADNCNRCYNLKPGGRGGWIPMYGDDNPMRRPEVATRVGAAIKASITDDERDTRSERMSRLRRSGVVISPGGHGFDRTGLSSWNKGLVLGPETQEVRKRKQLAAKKRAEHQDMGALGRGKKYNLQPRTCPHCGLHGAGPNMTRYHYDRCKHARS